MPLPSRAATMLLLALMAGVLLASSSCSAARAALTREENDALLEAAAADPQAGFASWAARHGRVDLLRVGDAGPGAPATRLQRAAFDAWRDNLAFARRWNAENKHGHWVGLNALAGLTFGEYQQRLLGTRPSLLRRRPSAAAAGRGASWSTTTTRVTHHQHHGAPSIDSEAQAAGFSSAPTLASSSLAGAKPPRIPAELDWRKQRAVVHKVKNQAQCGSCWAFAAAGAIEGVNAIRTGELLSLSEQELVDCDRDYDMGCQGGMMDNAFEWVQAHGGLHLDEAWPYTGVDTAQCSLDAHRSGRVVTIDGHEDVPVGDEEALLRAVARQPVAVAVEADSRAFQLYVGGVMSDPSCGSQLNHGVLVVGYGGLDNERGRITPASSVADPNRGPYFLVRNSWGPEWGDEGYIKLQMGYRDNATGLHGLCGITLAASFPVKTRPNPPAPPPAPPSPPSPPHPHPHPPSPPSPPEPVKCDDTQSCPPATTCCCMDSPSSPDDGDDDGNDSPHTTALFPSRLWFHIAAAGAASPPAAGASGSCQRFGCCPIEGAVCCEDRMHCCPPQLPVCDTDTGRCLLGRGAGGGAALPAAIPWLATLPSIPRQVAPQRQPVLEGSWLRPPRRHVGGTTGAEQQQQQQQ